MFSFNLSSEDVDTPLEANTLLNLLLEKPIKPLPSLGVGWNILLPTFTVPLNVGVPLKVVVVFQV